MTQSIENILQERGKAYGDFSSHAAITQALKREAVRFKAGSYQTTINDVQREALEMIFHKIGRILNGNPNIRDHWDDIAGYAKLAADRCPTS